MASYADALLAEARARLPGTGLDTLYVGGGTPTYGDAGRLARVLEGIRDAAGGRIGGVHGRSESRVARRGEGGCPRGGGRESRLRRRPVVRRGAPAHARTDPPGCGHRIRRRPPADGRHRAGLARPDPRDPGTDPGGAGARHLARHGARTGPRECLRAHDRGGNAVRRARAPRTPAGARRRSRPRPPARRGRRSSRPPATCATRSATSREPARRPATTWPTGATRSGSVSAPGAHSHAGRTRWKNVDDPAAYARAIADRGSGRRVVGDALAEVALFDALMMGCASWRASISTRSKPDSVWMRGHRLRRGDRRARRAPGCWCSRTRASGSRRAAWT